MPTILWLSVEKSACRVLGFIHLSLAIAVLAGGAKRFPAPSYTSMLNLTHGHAWPYGVLWLIGGLTMLLNKTLWRVIGCSFIVVVSCLWASLFAIAAWEIPTAAITPVVAYGGYAFINATMASLMIMRLWRRRGNGAG